LASRVRARAAIGSGVAGGCGGCCKCVRVVTVVHPSGLGTPGAGGGFVGGTPGVGGRFVGVTPGGGCAGTSGGGCVGTPGAGGDCDCGVVDCSVGVV